MKMTEKNKIVRLNPISVAPPVGNYSHVTIVPKDATIYTFSGQIGTDDSGAIPESFNAQIANTFVNLTAVLNSQELSFENIIKVNIWATKEIDWDYFYTLWNDKFNNYNPSMTIAYITALGLPSIDIEIEVWAAK